MVFTHGKINFFNKRSSYETLTLTYNEFGTSDPCPCITKRF